LAVVNVATLLGGEAVFGQRAGFAARVRRGTPADWIEAVRRGLPAGSVDAIAKAVELTQAELSATLAIPERTLVRRKKEGTLSTDESAKLLRVARVMQRATEVFEERVAALRWLKGANKALDDVTPLSLLDTELGAEAVMDTLGRIEHGVFA
jgi:putative toxin-antitoxin system antitoxin component (TIGR02293 family)